MKSDPLRRTVEALRYWEQRQAAAAHNLANAGAEGFKAERVFAHLLDGAELRAGARTDPRPGSLSSTGRPLDLALEGPGFFVVDTPRGERLTRRGAFRLDATGTLVDGRGHPVLVDGAPAVLPDGEVEVDSEGQVTVDGTPVGRLSVVLPSDPAGMIREDGLYFEAPGGGETVDYPRILQGSLEESNLDPLDAMVELIEIRRGHGVVHRALGALDQTLETITSRLGRVR